MISEGTRVSYIGPFGELQFEDQGKVIALAGRAAHVRWDKGAFTLTELTDLAPVKNASGVESDLDESLDVPGLSATAALAVYDEDGLEGLLTALDESGVLSGYTEAVEEAVDALVAVTARSGSLVKLEDDVRSEVALAMAKELLKRV